MRYRDENGEFIIGFISGFIRGLVQGDNPFKTGWRGGVNEVKIWAGLFVSDPNKNFGQRLWETVSRFTWQLPQTIVGFVFSHISNWGWQTDKVDYKYGATVLSGNFFGSGGAVTLGSYINGTRSLAADPNNSLFQHEYGHYLQSQKMGWGYLSRVGIPSLMGAANYDDGNHDFQPYEQDANRRAFNYFNENVKGFYKSFNDRHLPHGWNFYNNPLDVNHIGISSRYGYSDYNNSNDMDLVNSLSLHAHWYDYVGWLDGTVGALCVGIGNGIYFNKHRIK